MLGSAGTATKTPRPSRPDDGNAMFLILIAVALFAALSYAVTTSGRGSGSVQKEQSVLHASLITQTGASLRTTVMRMLLTGTQISDLDFACATGEDCVFAPDGGGAVQPDLPDAIAGVSYSGVQFYPYSFGVSVPGVGTSAPEALLVVGEITPTICNAINKGLGIAAYGTDSNDSDNLIDAYPGVVAGCYDADSVDGAPNPKYYHVLAEG